MAEQDHNNNDYMLRRIAELERELAETKTEAKKRRLELRELKEAHATLQTERTALEGDRDQWKTKAEAAPGTVQAENDQLRQELRTLRHHAAWEKAVSDQLHDKVTVDKLWGELQYKPGDELPTPEQITEQVKAARESAPYLFKNGVETTQDASGEAKRARPSPLDVQTSASQGRPDTSSRTAFRVTKQQLGDARWMSDRLNQKALSEAQQNGSLEIVG